MTNNGSVVIDAGHGGSAPAGRSSAYGVRGPNGAYEKDVMLALAQRVAAHYGPGAALTRASDVNVPLAERTAMAQRLGAPVFISLHANSGPPGARGAETYVHDRGTARSMALADAIQRELGAYGHATAPIGREALAVLSPDRLPSQTAACLLEVDYLSDPYGERRLTDPGQLDRLGAAIARGIRRYMGQPALAQGQQLETIAAIAEVAGAFFETIRALGQIFQADGLTVHSNETKVTHRTGPSRRNPWQDRDKTLVQFDCTAGTFSSARADFNVQWQANGNDIDHCRIWKALDTGWNGRTGSTLDVTFTGSDGNNYTPRGVACVLMHVSGRLDPAGGGDINFDFDVLVKADGTIENHGPVNVPSGQDASQFTFTALVGGGWRIAQNP